MNCSTTRCTTPAAAPQSGRGESALPQRPGTQTQLPFAALPHELRKDPRLKRNRTAIVLAAALLEYAPGYKPYCFPTNARLCADLGCCETTVRTALNALAAAGWIRVELGPRQPNGRRIWLTWRESRTATRPLRQVPDTPRPAIPQAQPGASSPRPGEEPPQPTGPEEEWLEEDGRNVTRSPITCPDTQAVLAAVPSLAVSPAPESPQAVLAAVPSLAVSPAPESPQAAPESPQIAQSAPYPGPQASPLIDDLKAVPGAAPDFVRRTAFRLAAFLGDLGSAGYYLSILARVAGGEVGSLERLLAAYAAGSKAKGSARKPGAVFCWAFSNWTRPPKPSEIRYYQTPSSSPSKMPEPPAMTVAEEIAELRAILAQPRPSPFATSARRRLVELGADPGQ